MEREKRADEKREEEKREEDQEEEEVQVSKPACGQGTWQAK